ERQAALAARGAGAHARGAGPVKSAAAALLLLAACSSTPSKSECDGIVENLVNVFTAGKMGEDDSRVPKDCGPTVEPWRRLLTGEADQTPQVLIQLCQTQMSSRACLLAVKNERELVACLNE